MFAKTLDSKSTYTLNGIKLKDITEPIFKNGNSRLTGVMSYYKVSKEMEMRPDKIAYAAHGDMKYAEIILKESGIDNPFAIEFNDELLVPSLNTVYTNIKDLEDFMNSGEYENESSHQTPYDLVANYHKYIDKNKLPKENGSTVSGVNIPSSSSSIDPNLLSSTFAGVTSSGKQIPGVGNNTGVGGLANGIGSPSIAGYDANGNPIYGGNDGNTPDNVLSGTGGNNAQTPVEANMANRGQSGIFVSNGKIYFGNGVIANSSDVTDITGSNDVDNELVDCAKNGVTLGQFLNATIKNSIK
jgi:hypothetical protein